MTERELRNWQYGNPLGYTTWFRERSTELQTALLATAETKHKRR